MAWIISTPTLRLCYTGETGIAIREVGKGQVASQSGSRVQQHDMA